LDCRHGSVNAGVVPAWRVLKHFRVMFHMC
jgi:hypothetical protein